MGEGHVGAVVPGFVDGGEVLGYFFDEGDEDESCGEGVGCQVCAV